MRVVIFDPAVENVNAGDEIISDAIARLGLPGLDDAEHLTTHRPLNRRERRCVSQADIAVLGGTNALSSHMERFRQWLIDPDLAIRLRHKLVLLGVGWWQYQGPPCTYTSLLLKQLLTHRVPQATRDAYTLHRIRALGFEALMTGCPTVWKLDDVAPAKLGASDAVVTTITDYKQDVAADGSWLRALSNHYTELRMVGMGPGDRRYFESLPAGSATWCGQGVQDLRAALGGADFVGTRLHGGILALSMGRPSLVLAVDNRAEEMRKSIGLPVCDRGDITGLRRLLISGNGPMTLPHEAINAWTDGWSNVVGGAPVDSRA